MKKLFALISILGILTWGTTNVLLAQESDSSAMQNDTTNVQTEEVVAPQIDKEVAIETTEEAEEEQSFHQVIKEKFIEGGPVFMSIVLICLIFGLALAIERIIYLALSYTNTNKLISSVEEALNNGGVEAAKEVCRNTSGPVASIFYQGLDRINEGIDVVEKSIVSYGGVQMGRLEKGLSWISLFIALAPMLGFMGTVIGMIGAFDAIAAAGDISPQIVADGIKVALLTTVFGLIVAIILQIFYNLIVAIVDGLVNNMEDASISLIDILIKYQEQNK